MLEWIATHPWWFLSFWAWSGLMIALGSALQSRLQQVMRGLLDDGMIDFSETGERPDRRPPV